MQTLELAPQHKKALRDVWENRFSKPFDPALDYKIEAVHVTPSTTIEDVFRAIRPANERIFFSVLSKSRPAVNALVKKGAFPGKQFCAVSPKISMMFVRGHKDWPKVGDVAQVCILRDRNAVRVGSPSVIQKGSSTNAERSDSHHLTSANVELVAVVQARITNTSAVRLKAVSSVRPKKKNIFAEEIDEKLKIKMRKIRRKRMDNFGIKEDF